jgi:hypothetical protein
MPTASKWLDGLAFAHRRCFRASRNG